MITWCDYGWAPFRFQEERGDRVLIQSAAQLARCQYITVVGFHGMAAAGFHVTFLTVYDTTLQWDRVGKPLIMIHGLVTGKACASSPIQAGPRAGEEDDDWQ
jgi:hypothetical protein